MLSIVSSFLSFTTLLTYTLPESPSSYTFDLEKSQRTTPTKDDVKFQDSNSTDTIYSVFRKNVGQMADYLSYYANFAQGIVGFGSSTVYFTVCGFSFQLAFIDAHPVEPIGNGELQGYSNYFIGETAFNKMKHFSYITYENLYNGITLRYQITSKGLKYEFLVDPYADINQIKMAYLGVDEVKVAPTRVELTTSEYTFVDDELNTWYADNGEKISCSFISREYSIIDHSIQPSLFADLSFVSTIQFELDPLYDRSRPIIIDPLLLAYSTYIGGGLDDIGNDIILDNSNNIYITGLTKSIDYPNVNAFNSTIGGNRDVFVSKLSADGSTLLYSTFIGGYEFDTGNSIVLDSSGNLYITGATKSSNFPTLNAYDSSHGGFSDAFLVKLSANGSLIYSTFIGGSAFDSGDSLVLDSSNNIYITGNTNSIDFPIVNAYDSSHNGGSDAFIVKISTNDSSLLYSTYIGGDRDETLEFMVKHMDITLDNMNNIYITGTTGSNDFPTVNAYNSSLNGGLDIFFVVLSANGSTLLYSTYIGGRLDDFSNSFVLDSSGNIYITGTTNSENFPAMNAYDSILDGRWDAFVVKLSVNGTLLYSTFIGGSSDESSNSIVIDGSDNIYITGETSSVDFPVVNAYDSTFKGENDVFFVKIPADGSTILSSLIIGGSEFDTGNSIVLNNLNAILITGVTKSSDFPMVNAYDPTFNAFSDLFIVKIDKNSTINTETGIIMEPNVMFGIILLLGIAAILLSVILYQKR